MKFVRPVLLSWAAKQAPAPGGAAPSSPAAPRQGAEDVGPRSLSRPFTKQDVELLG